MGMYSILIVDDEAVERNGIQLLMQKYHFQLCIHEAANGREALDFLKHHKVDLLFTDVKMPFMDGLELSKEAKKLYPDIKIIIFSGYGEFEYAKMAIALGVSDYILKPIDIQEFKSTIEKTIRDLDIQKQEAEKFNFGLNYEKQHILFNLINGTSKEVILSQSKLLSDIDFIEKYKKMFLLEFNQGFFESCGVEFLTKINLVINKDFDYVNLNSHQSVLLYHGTKKLDFMELAQKIYDLISKEYQSDCYIAISGDFSGSSNIAEEFCLLEECMENKFFISNSFIFSLDHSLAPSISTSETDENLMECIRYDIKTKDYYSLKKHIELLCNKYQNKHKYSYLYVKYIFSNLLQEIYQAISKFNEDDLNQGIDKIFKSNDFHNVLSILMQAVEYLEKNEQSPQTSHREIEYIKKYIYAHYSRDLSLKELADHACLAPNYLSHLFKKETGSGLNKFIKSYRMERAKELLENTNMKIVHISKSVGYTNVSYFCQSFREFYGISPDKYRQRDEQS